MQTSHISQLEFGFTTKICGVLPCEPCAHGVYIVSGDGVVSVIICPPVQEIEPQLPGPPPSLSLNRNDHFDHFYFSENEREWQR
jgi:hypothetical protein